MRFPKRRDGQTSIRMRILKLVEAGQTVTVARVMEETGTTRESANSILSEMARAGAIARVAHGHYGKREGS